MTSLVCRTSVGQLRGKGGAARHRMRHYRWGRCLARCSRPRAVTEMSSPRPSSQCRPMKPRSIASSQTGRRGQEVRHASITSEYGLDPDPIHSSRSSIRASTGSDNATSPAVICAPRCWLVGIVGQLPIQAEPHRTALWLWPLRMGVMSRNAISSASSHRTTASARRPATSGRSPRASIASTVAPSRERDASSLRVRHSRCDLTTLPFSGGRSPSAGTAGQPAFRRRFASSGIALMTERISALTE